VLNETIDQLHRCLLSFLNLAGKPSLMIAGETIVYHSCIRMVCMAGISTSSFRRSSKAHSFSWWRHILSRPLEPILTSSSSILVPLLTGMPSRYLWSLVLPFIRSAVPYIQAWLTPSNHTPIPALTGGKPMAGYHRRTEESRRHSCCWLATGMATKSLRMWYSMRTLLQAERCWRDFHFSFCNMA